MTRGERKGSSMSVGQMRAMASLLEGAADELPSRMEKVKLSYAMANQTAELLREGATAMEANATTTEAPKEEAPQEEQSKVTTVADVLRDLG